MDATRLQRWRCKSICETKKSQQSIDSSVYFIILIIKDETIPSYSPFTFSGTKVALSHSLSGTTVLQSSFESKSSPLIHPPSTVDTDTASAESDRVVFHIPTSTAIQKRILRCTL